MPADRRLFGLDRRTLLPAAVVAVLFVFTVWVMPAINRAVPVTDPVRAGDVIQVGDVEFVPAVGANIATGLRQGRPDVGNSYPKIAVVTYQGTTFKVRTDDYDGTPAQLLEQIKKNNEGTRVDGGGFRVNGEPVTIVNADGDKGVAAHYDSASAVGLVAAFVFDGTGVEIEAVGPETLADSVGEEVAAMVQSVQPVSAGSGS